LCQHPVIEFTYKCRLN